MEILLVVFLWHLDESLLKCSLRLLHWSLYCHAPRCVVADKVARYCKKVMKNKGKKKIGYLMQYFQSFSEVPNFRHFFPIKLERAKWGVHMEMFLQLCVNDLSHQFIKFFFFKFLLKQRDSNTDKDDCFCLTFLKKIRYSINLPHLFLSILIFCYCVIVFVLLLGDEREFSPAVRTTAVLPSHSERRTIQTAPQSHN